MRVHPFEPLSAEEVSEAIEIPHTLPSFMASTRIISIMLREHAKEFVYQLPCVTASDREADAVLFKNGVNTAYFVVLNLTDEKLKAQSTRLVPIRRSQQMSRSSASVPFSPTKSFVPPSSPTKTESKTDKSCNHC